MMKRAAILTVLALVSAPYAAQSQKPANRTPAVVEPVSEAQVASIEMIDVEILPPLDMGAIQAQDFQREQSGEPARYAIPTPVRMSPNVRGTWETLDAKNLVWRLRIQALGADSINLGFTRYLLPQGARLLIYDANDTSRAIRPFTAADNKDHGELWTPPLATDDLVIELTVPVDVADQLTLQLTQIGHGYRFFGGSDRPARLSGSCNVDVVCSEGDGWRNEISSVAAYSTGGSIFCTGFMVNNTSEDGTPYFMTAFHCGIGAGNASSLVTFWNFDNSTCRPVGASGGLGDGPLTQFNTGATFRAGYAPSDFTLVEMDAEPDADWGVTFAGWDRTSTDPPSAVAIHHPDGEEKRISFENQPTTTTSYLSSPVPGDGTHVRVEDWDLGTTEPGSSGSPLFDDDHRVIGQLHGGFAACGNDSDDWYGRFSVSWDGGGTASTRLSNWLDPGVTGALTVDTAGGIAFRVAPAAELISSGLAGGPFSPSSRTYTVSNTGETAIDYSVTAVEPWISLTNASGTLAAGGDADVEVSINATADGLGNGSYTGDVTFTNVTDGMGNTTREVRLEVGRVTFAAGDTPLGIPDGSNGTSTPGSVTSTITASGHPNGTVGDVDVGLDIVHTYVGDLCMALEHAGKTVHIVLRSGAVSEKCHYGSPFGCSDDNYDVVLSDEGTGGSIEDLCSAGASSPPDYTPVNALSAFDGLPANGDWILTVTDSAGGDTGSLAGWSIQVVVQTPSGGPENIREVGKL